ncbi:MAG TPA: hypothetical protein VK563_09305, partial [Puia sp.]|nr:hypothetical protein [Puia sp.]
DSYVQKVGAAAFRDFVAANKRDFILFQLEVSLKDAAGDTNKKAGVVNQVAETIARINKAEDFTRQEDYIRQCAELLKIDEAGLHVLVNKYIRERVSKQENRSSAADASAGRPGAGMGFTPQSPEGTAPDVAQPQDEESINLLFKHEQNERGMIRSLLDFGLRSWDENNSVANYIFAESSDYYDLIDNKHLVRILDTYKTWYEEGLEPSTRSFLYHEDQELSALAVSIMDFRHELSPNWKDHYEGPLPTREDLYKEEVQSTMGYLRLRKIKRLMEENQKDLEKPHTPDEQMMLIQTHQHLKQMEMQILKDLGTVIVK